MAIEGKRTKLLTLPEPASSARPDLRRPELYINRELGLLMFQQRVLEEAQDSRNPLLERVKFLSIVGSNLDEFFMVRVAGLQSQVKAGTAEAGPEGMSPSAQLVAIRREVKKLMSEAFKCWRDELKPALKAEGIEVLDYASLTDKQQAIADEYFRETVFPVLTPLAVDPGRPFPHISNLSLNLAIAIRAAHGVEHFARLKVPNSLPQLVSVAKLAKKSKRVLRKEHKLVWLEQVIAANLSALFPGMEVIETHPFRVIRDAELAIRELEAEDLLETMEEGVKQRYFGTVVSLRVTDDMPENMVGILRSNLEVEDSHVYRLKGPLGLSRLMELYKLDRPDLKYPPFVPSIPESLLPVEDEDIFSAIRRNDVLLHHPFDSFQPVVDFVRKAAHDPNVLAIKVTLYRVGRNSPIVDALLEAMEEGKQVAVLVELKARFDEESNIEWARALESVGVHVVYGLVGLKIHCKTLMVVRREGDVIRRYVHISTGNYNAVTAHLYTDIGLLTCDEQIASDVTDLFNYLTGYSAKSDYMKLLVGPVTLRARMEDLVRREINNAKSGHPAHIILKMNALVDPSMIRLLYEASQAGVKTELLVRGVCCLRPGLPGISENITVTSIVGRFLEHSRLFYFLNGGAEEVYMGSADLMPRNLNRRVEVLVPITRREHVRAAKELLSIYLADTVKARDMQSDGTYVRRKSGSNAVNSQEWLILRSREVRRSG